MRYARAPLVEFTGTSRFVVRRRLGAGGMGVVYEALDTERGDVVALKTLRNLDARALYRFKAEFRALADVAHPNLVRLGELFGDGDDWFFTMELVDGPDVLSWIRGAPGARGGGGDTGALTLRFVHAEPTPVVEPAAVPPPDERRLRDAVRQLAQGIAALHGVQKVHRDVKPSNVMVTAGGRVVLLDFGLATDADRPDRLDSGTSIVGTATYMAPEQARSLAVGPEADWYALGAILYEALTGRPPFVGAPMEVLLAKQAGEPPPPRALRPDAPRDLDALCAELLRRAPRDRPAAAEILARLGAAAPVFATAHPGSPPVHDAPVFVGRDAELAALAAAFAEAERGLPISMFVLGESGMGKSALVRHFLDGVEAARADVLVLAGRCYERESVPFKAFDDVVDALAAHLQKRDQDEVLALLSADAATLVRVFPVLRRVPALARASTSRGPDPQDLRERAFAALRALLVALARSRPVVLFVDDFQWADADSLALFSAVMHGLEAPPVLFVATVRAAAEEVAAGGLPPALASVESVPGDLRTLSVHGLPPEEALGLAARLLGDDGGREVRAIVDEAAGHPLFIHELVRHVAGATRRRDVRLDDALWARIGRVEPAARRLLELVAVAGEPLSQRVAMMAAGVDATELGRVGGVLRVASLVRTGGARGGDTIECYHDRIREAVVARLDADTLRRHHEALANAIEAAAGAAHDAQALVRHLEAAGLLERAAEQAARAARSAADGLAFEQASAMYALALRLGRHADATARELRIAMADALVDAGRGTDAADAYLAAAEGADAATRLECRRKAAGHLLITGDLERGLAALDGVLAELGEQLPPTPQRALASFLWNRARLRLRGTRFTPRDELSISPRDLLLIDVYHSVGVGLGLVDPIRGADFQARGLRAALRVGDLRRVTRGLALHAGLVASHGPRANARAMKQLARCAELVASTNDPFLHGWVIGGTGFAHYLGGRFRVGAELLEQAVAPLRHDTQGNIWELNTVRIFRLLALRQLGRWRELRAGLTELLRDAVRRGDRYAETTLTRSANLAWLVSDEPARARQQLASARWTPPEGGYHMQHWYELRALAELALYEQDGAAARDLFAHAFDDLGRSLLLRVQTIKTEALWLRGRAALLRCALGEDPALTADAADAARRLDREGVGYARVWARMLDAGVAAQRGDAAAARARLDEAAALAREAELMMCWAAARLAQDDPRGEELMAAEGVKQPLRMLQVLLPGVRRPDG